MKKLDEISASYGAVQVLLFFSTAVIGVLVYGGTSSLLIDFATVINLTNEIWIRLLSAVIPLLAGLSASAVLYFSMDDSLKPLRRLSSLTLSLTSQNLECYRFIFVPEKTTVDLIKVFKGETEYETTSIPAFSWIAVQSEDEQFIWASYNQLSIRIDKLRLTWKLF